MDWAVRGSNPGGERLPLSGRTGPEAHPASYTLDTRSFPDINRSGRGVNHPPSSRAEVNPLNAELNPTCHLLAFFGAHHILHISRIRVKERVELHLNTLLCAFMAVYMIKFT